MLFSVRTSSRSPRFGLHLASPTILGLMNTKTALATITWQQRPLARCLRISLMVKTTMRQLHKNRGRVLPSSPKAASRRSQDKHESCRIGFPRGAGVLFQLLQISVSLIIHQFFGDFAERERDREREAALSHLRAHPTDHTRCLAFRCESDWGEKIK